MRHSVISSSDHRSATLWFLGWGFDDAIAPSLDLRADAIILWDYSDLTLSLDLSQWDSFEIKAWSMGVWAADAFTAAHTGLAISRRTAYCGTPRPADASLGIGADAIRLTIDNWCEANREKFARKIAGSAALAPQVSEFMRGRSTSSQAEELTRILLAQDFPPPPVTWDVAVVGRRDRIFPPDNQRLWWANHAHTVEERDIPHWPF